MKCYSTVYHVKIDIYIYIFFFLKTGQGGGQKSLVCSWMTKIKIITEKMLFRKISKNEHIEREDQDLVSGTVLKR